MKNSRHNIFIALYCLYILTLGILCFIRPDSLPSESFDWFGLPADKAGHFLMFMPFPVLTFAVFIRKYCSRTEALKKLMFIVISGAVIAISTEIIQKILGYRAFEIHDFIADVAGISTGAVAVTIYIALNKKLK